MGIRETLNENPRLTTGVTAGIIGVALIWIIWSNLGGGAAPTLDGGGQVFFTDDDGKSWFADDAKKIPPFDHNGKPAYRAHVYKCDGKTFVNHMERYTDAAKKKMEALYAKPESLNDPIAMESIQQTGLEFKAPGTGNWVKMTDPKLGEVLKPKCSNPSEVEQVLP